MFGILFYGLIHLGDAGMFGEDIQKSNIVQSAMAASKSVIVSVKKVLATFKEVEGKVKEVEGKLPDIKGSGPSIDLTDIIKDVK
jgi:hypothetical protein